MTEHKDSIVHDFEGQHRSVRHTSDPSLSDNPRMNIGAPEALNTAGARSFSKPKGDHVSVQWHRLNPAADNPREVVFARIWQEEQLRCSGGELLDWILKDWTENPSQYWVKPCSDRDKAVAATIIQWLGTNCGIAFLADCINNSPGTKEYLRGLCFKGSPAPAAAGGGQ